MRLWTRLRPWLAGLGGVFAAGLGFLLLLALIAGWLRPDMSAPPPLPTPDKIAEA
ncbi:MAG: hypothetical protein HY021_08990, partial [Burkholderiales bacterium]|nr:hypothetical protein [Burkholderiales bacterium]